MHSAEYTLCLHMNIYKLEVNSTNDLVEIRKTSAPPGLIGCLSEDDSDCKR